MPVREKGISGVSGETAGNNSQAGPNLREIPQLHSLLAMFRILDTIYMGTTLQVFCRGQVLLEELGRGFEEVVGRDNAN